MCQVWDACTAVQNRCLYGLPLSSSSWPTDGDKMDINVYLSNTVTQEGCVGQTEGPEGCIPRWGEIRIFKGWCRRYHHKRRCKKEELARSGGTPRVCGVTKAIRKYFKIRRKGELTSSTAERWNENIFIEFSHKQAGLVTLVNTIHLIVRMKMTSAGWRDVKYPKEKWERFER